MSRLHVLSEKILEACWLAAIILAPLFFNVYSNRVFEPDKTALVRTLALVMAVAWLVLRADMLPTSRAERTQPNSSADSPAGRLRRAAGRWSRGNPLILPTLGMVAIYLVSTLASVSPLVSLLGSYTRMQGFYSTLSYVIIFLLAASTIRTRAQINRAITAALMASFPIAFYGLIQHYFLDPLPWGGDVTARVVSNMGNSIFVGAFLIMVIPLALGRCIETTGRIASSLRRQVWLYGAAIISLLVLAAGWALPFELGAKRLIEGHYQGTLTPEMLAASTANFNLALIITLLVILAWWIVGLVLKKRAGLFLLAAIYLVLLTVQGLALIFTQSRGPQLGLVAGLAAFALLYPLARGARWVAVAATALTLLGLVGLVFFNVAANSVVGGLRALPYIGRLGQVMQTEEGTGKVRVLIWQGALQLVLPHTPLWSPTGGEDPLNPIRPLIGYGPETLSVAYNRFYPPALGEIESRNATPDRAHNETFDALTGTGLLGFAVENILFLSVFYFGLKWVGLARTVRERNILIGLWYGAGVFGALVFGATLGWHMIGLGLPLGMVGGLFLYLAGCALWRVSVRPPTSDQFQTLLIVIILTAILAHFVEIHLGIAIASTRTYFWFLAALLVAAGTRLGLEEPTLPAAVASPAADQIERAAPTRTPRGKKGRAPGSRPPQRTPANTRPVERPAAARLISTSPLIAQAFIAGVILATMAYDYITITNLRAVPGESISALDIIVSALTAKATTAGMGSSLAMLWLFVGTFGVMLALALSEWGWNTALPLGEWLLAGGLFGALAVAILSSFLLYHTLLIGTSGAGLYDALLWAFWLFVAFVLVMLLIIAVTLQMDERLPTPWVLRPTNLIVAPIAFLAALLLVFSTNVSTVQADMIYKEASGQADANSLTEGIDNYKRALALQPEQDYYVLFLGRAYLEQAQTTQDARTRDQALKDAESALLQARQLNPLNTDHSANLARLHEAWAALVSEAAQREQEYQKSFHFYGDALRLSPNTVHLYDQLAVSQLEYARALDGEGRSGAAAQARAAAAESLARSYQIDPSFCLTLAVRGQVQNDWRAALADALEGIRRSSACDVFGQQGQAAAVQALTAAGERAAAHGQGGEFTAQLEQAASRQPSIELETALLNFYSKAGQIDQAIRATDAALALIPPSDENTRKQYTDFRAQLVTLQQAITKTRASPNDAEAHRALADLWLQRGQPELALPEYQRVAELLPTDYEAHRRAALLLVRQNRLDEAMRTEAATLALAPANARPFWERLGQALDAAQKGDRASALVMVQDLVKTTDSNDTLTLDALRALADKLQSS